MGNINSLITSLEECIYEDPKERLVLSGVSRPSPLITVDRILPASYLDGKLQSCFNDLLIPIVSCLCVVSGIVVVYVVVYVVYVVILWWCMW